MVALSQPLPQDISPCPEIHANSLLLIRPSKHGHCRGTVCLRKLYSLLLGALTAAEASDTAKNAELKTERSRRKTEAVKARAVQGETWTK